MKVSTIVIIGAAACAGLYLAESQDPICTSIKDTALKFGKTVVNTASYVISQLKPLIKNITDQAKDAIENIPDAPQEDAPVDGNVSFSGYIIPEQNRDYYELDDGTILSLPSGLVA